MPLSKYNTAFGGKPGAAAKAHAAMVKEYGEKKGEQVFYATKNKRGGNFTPTGNDNDGFNLGQTLQDHNTDGGTGQPTASIGTFSGSRSGWKRGDE